MQSHRMQSTALMNRSSAGIWRSMARSTILFCFRIQSFLRWEYNFHAVYYAWNKSFSLLLHKVGGSLKKPKTLLLFSIGIENHLHKWKMSWILSTPRTSNFGGMLPFQLGYWFTAQDIMKHETSHHPIIESSRGFAITQGTIEMSGTREARRWAKSSVWVRCCGTWQWVSPVSVGCHQCHLFNRGEVVT